MVPVPSRVAGLCLFTSQLTRLLVNQHSFLVFYFSQTSPRPTLVHGLCFFFQVHSLQIALSQPRFLVRCSAFDGHPAKWVIYAAEVNNVVVLSLIPFGDSKTSHNTHNYDQKINISCQPISISNTCTQSLSYTLTKTTGCTDYCKYLA
jgi:hypothetical protein